MKITFGRLLKNKVLMCINGNSCLYCLGYYPFWTYMPKYMEIQYRVSASFASLITGQSKDKLRLLFIDQANTHDIQKGYGCTKNCPGTNWSKKYVIWISLKFLHFYLVLSLLSCVILVRSSLITNQGRLHSRPEFWYSGLLHYFICMYLPTSLLSEVGVNCPLGRSRLWAMELYFLSAIYLSSGHLTSTERSFRPFYSESRDSAQNAPHLYINVGKSLLMFLWS